MLLPLCQLVAIDQSGRLLSFDRKGTQVLSDSFLKYESYGFENFAMQNYLILVTSLAANFCLQTSKTT